MNSSMIKTNSKFTLAEHEGGGKKETPLRLLLFKIINVNLES